ncbi:MAG: flotillin-like protein FloA [Opitutales bacterium]
MISTFEIIVIAVVGLALLFFFFLVVSFLGVFIKAWSSGAYVGPWPLIAMRFFRKLPYSLIVDARIMATKAGMTISTDQIETHYMAGGDIIQTTQSLINAQKAGIPLGWDRACAIDLATKGTEKSVLEAVRTSINPKVIDCPNPKSSGRNTIDGVAKDGIQVKVKARVTVRTNLEHYVGSAQEETIIARVGEGIVTTIGSAESYKWVLENPDSISRNVLNRGLDTGTAFEILSIDIADVDVGENIGAQLQEAQAEANKNMAQAQAEIRRAAAVALEQEMKARVQEMQAKVVEAQAEVPLAMAEAFRSGSLGVMDYMRYKNIESDTQMRGSIANPEGKKQDSGS